MGVRLPEWSSKQDAVSYAESGGFASTRPLLPHCNHPATHYIVMSAQFQAGTVNLVPASIRIVSNRSVAATLPSAPAAPSAGRMVTHLPLDSLTAIDLEDIGVDWSSVNVEPSHWLGAGALVWASI